MGQIGVVVFALILGAMLLFLLSRRWMVDALVEALNNFRGGPPTAMHPSPSDDGFLLRRRARTADE
jgi:hypothetical protein